LRPRSFFKSRRKRRAALRKAAQDLAAGDTAGAARDVALHHDGATGAIAGRPAAVRYGLAVLEDDIADVQDNNTRFVAVKRGMGASDQLGRPA